MLGKWRHAEAGVPAGRDLTRCTPGGGTVRNAYGYFTDDGREFVITRPDTPAPWVNQISNEDYCMLVSQTGGGYSFVYGSGFNRIQRALPGDMVLMDRPGRYLYLRDEETGEYWSAGWQPVCRDPQAWECRHGLGYTRIRSRTADIEMEAVYLSYRWASMRSCGASASQTGATAPGGSPPSRTQKLVLGAYQPDLLERSFHVLFNETTYHQGILYATKRYWPTVSLTSTSAPTWSGTRWYTLPPAGPRFIMTAPGRSSSAPTETGGTRSGGGGALPRQQRHRP